MKKIQAYECSDGKIFTDKKDADRHEKAYHLSRRKGDHISQIMKKTFGSSPAIITVNVVEGALSFMEEMQELMEEIAIKEAV